MFDPLYRSFVDGRDPGTREVEPIYRGGRTIRFTNLPRERTILQPEDWSAGKADRLRDLSSPMR